MTPPPRPTRFSVLTLNLRFGLADDGDQDWDHRRPVVREFLANHACDLMLFQEANDFQIDFIAECLPGHDIIGRRHPAPPFWQNNIICFRAPWQLARWQHFFLSPTPAIPSRFAESRWPRQCTMGCFRCEGYELVCATTHLDFDATVQIASANIIQAHIIPWAVQRPVILGGDFNCTPHSDCHAAFTDARTPPEQDRLQFRNVLSPSYPGTFHDFQGGRGRACIDWILYQGGIVLQQAGVLQFPPMTCYPSDHYPVTADFFWETASPP
jgi:endonuclease/exonuclease/phosphatase family metal-dependent hydrolase